MGRRNHVRLGLWHAVVCSSVAFNVVLCTGNLNHRHELLPAVEERFHGIGEGWARFTYGGSTGGWEALAVQLMYPDDLNGCYAACPDSISFEA